MPSFTVPLLSKAMSGAITSAMYQVYGKKRVFLYNCYNTEIFFFGKVNSTKLHENGAERMGGQGRHIQLHSHLLGFKEMGYF